VRVLLTGATGDLGQCLLRDLVEAGHEVLAVSRRAPRGGDARGVRWLTADLACAAPPAADLDGIDAVVHLAGQRYAPLPAARFVETNVQATSRLLERLEGRRSERPPHVVFASTIYVYGEGRAGVYTEHDVAAPGTVYGASKLQAERRIVAAGAQAGMPFTILRLPAVYGTDGLDPLRAMADVFARLAPFVIGDGTQERSLLAIGNLSRVVRAALGNPRWDGTTLNVADPEPYRMIDLARHLAPGRRVWHVPAGAVRAACAARPLLGRAPAYRDACDRLRRLGQSFAIDTSALAVMGVDALDSLALGPR
jgi:UDP-glucose 4-epimerase